MARLTHMRTLIAAGTPVAEAAQAVLDQRTTGHVTDVSVVAADMDRRTVARRGGGRRLSVPSATTATRELAAAAMAMDSPAIAELIDTPLRRYGVVMTWTDVIAPVLVSIGRRFDKVGDCVDVEHMLSEAVRGALSAVWTRPRAWADVPPVLLASIADDFHTLPLHALAAALAERDRPSRLLGAAVPLDALTSAIARTGPSAVFVWAQLPGTGQAPLLKAIAGGRPRRRIVAGGDGWTAHEVATAKAHYATSLSEAVETLTRDW